MSRSQSEASPALEGAGTRQSLGDPLVLGLSIGFIVLFVTASLYDIEGVAGAIATGFAWTAKVLGSYFQSLLLVTFFVAVGVALSPAARARVGNLDSPEISTFKWLSIIMCTLLAGGGVFFAAGEPIYHFVVTPPAFETEAGSVEAVSGALAQSFMHWGFLAWAVLGSLTAVVLAHAHYVCGLPLQPRTLLVPVLGERLMRGPLGGVVDACCVIAVALMAAILLYMGAGQIGALQQFIVITAIPVSLVLLPSFWTGPQAALAMAREQGILLDQ